MHLDLHSLKGKIFICLIGLLNFLAGFTSLILAGSMNVLALIAVPVYVVIAISVFVKSTRFKALLYFVLIPIEVFNLDYVASLHSQYGSAGPYGIGFSEVIMFVIIPVITIITDVVYVRIASGQ